MGILQVVETIKQLTGVGSSLVNKILQFDAMMSDFTLIDIYPNPDCALCGSNPTIKSI